MKNKRTKSIRHLNNEQRKLTTESFIEKTKKIHGNRYNYDNVVYKNINTKVKIWCNVHKEFFFMTPYQHLNKGSNCPKCSYLLRGKDKTRSNSDFIKSMKEIYGDQFTYENTNYTGTKNLVTITCKIHEDFERYPSDLLKGMGCSKCIQETKRKKLEDKFIRRAKEINGDKNDYSLVHYIDDRTKVEIVCGINGHGSFFQSPSKHIYRRQDCPKCGLLKIGDMKRKTNEQFIQESKALFKNENGNDLLGYDKCIYKSAKDYVELFCKEHREYFKVLPDSHTGKRHQSCPKCSLERQGKLEVYDTNSFIERAQKVHVDENGEPLYTYKDAIYTYSKNKLKITCRLHGNFLQSPDSHVRGKHGCPACATENTALGQTHTTEQFVKDSMRIHKNKDGTPKYGYEGIIYEGNEKPVDITCFKHGKFRQTPSNHKRGKGCPICASSGPEKRIFMYLKKLNIDFIKEYKINGYDYKYDFFLKDLNLLIEYDGAQHFKPIKYLFNGHIDNPDEALKERQKIDRLKDKIAEDNNYIIERIPYTLENKLEQSVLFVISKHYPYKHNNIYYPSLKEFLISQNLPENTSSNDVKHNLTYNRFDYENDIP